MALINVFVVTVSFTSILYIFSIIVLYIVIIVVPHRTESFLVILLSEYFQLYYLIVVNALKMLQFSLDSSCQHFSNTFFCNLQLKNKQENAEH